MLRFSIFALLGAEAFAHACDDQTSMLQVPIMNKKNAAGSARRTAGAAAGLTVFQYGHAFKEPYDYTDEEIQQIASRFAVFTVEKRHAYRTYGDSNEPTSSPRHYNSIHATVETARRIKAVNPNVKVLMYWNAAIHYNMYECEDQVQPSWLMPADFHPLPYGNGLYDYQNPDFRQWWVNCAVGAMTDIQHEGLLDGVFLDATPKVGWQGRNALSAWNGMVDDLSTRLEEHHLVMYNGFHLPRNNRVRRIKAGLDQLAHANLYCESFGRAVTTQDNDVTIGFLNALQVAFNQYPSKKLFGHGPNSQSDFSYMYGCFLMVAPQAGAYFLANSGYSITQGALDEHEEYGLLLGAPLGNFNLDDLVLTRSFEHGSVTVDLATRTANFIVTAEVNVAQTEPVGPLR